MSSAASLPNNLKDNLSLKSIFPDAFATAYRFALLGAQKDTGLPEEVFPAAFPWNSERVIAEGFLLG